MKLFLDAVNI